MRVRRLLLALCVAAALIPVASAQAAPAQPAPPAVGCPARIPRWAPPATDGGVALGEHLVTMSDGVDLALDVTLPAGEGPFPAVVSITGYGKSAPLGGDLTRHGYAMVSVDDRGTGASGGQWDAWGERTRADYAELLDWLVEQPWSDGSVALAGASYGGITALFTAATGHPAVKAVFAEIPMGDAYRDITFAGGQVNAAFIPAWMGLVTGLGVMNAVSDPEVLVDHLLGAPAFQVPTVLEAALGGAAAYDGPFWRQRSPLAVVEQIEAPTFIVGGLDDIFQRGEPLLYEALADHTEARLLLGPWSHLTAGQGLPADGVPSVGSLKLQWFDAHVKGLATGVECVPAVTQYVRGADEYRFATTWPVPDLNASRWYMRGDGSLTGTQPAAAEPGRTYLQLPISGICSRSTNQWLIGVLTGSPCETDNRLDESMPVSLTYSSEPFTAPTYVNGPIQADVWIVPSTNEAMVSVAVSDVAPDGTSRGLTNGLLLASHRAVDPARSRMLDGQSIQPWHPFGRADVLPVTPGVPTLVPVEVFPTSAVLEAGHRLRVTVAPYDVPHALPPVPAALATLAGPVTVLSDAEHPSSIVLPVVSSTDSVVEPGALGGMPDVPEEPADLAAAPIRPVVADDGSAGASVLGRRLERPAAPTQDGTMPATGRSLPTLAAAAALAAAVALWRRARVV